MIGPLSTILPGCRMPLATRTRHFDPSHITSGSSATRKLGERKLSREILKAAEETGALSIIVGGYPLRAALGYIFSERRLGHSPVRIWQTRFR